MCLEQHAKGHDTEALRAANWMVDHQQADGTWRYNFAYENASVGVDLGAGWISALTQGQALPLLVRAWKLTGDTAYLDAGRAALRPFERTVDKNRSTPPEMADRWAGALPRSFRFVLV